MENWKDIEGYEGRYQVSDQGRVRSLKYGKERILKSVTNQHGYLVVQLSKDGKRKTYQVHRLVAEVFVPNDDPEHKTQCNHISEKKLDCRAINLNWMTPKANINWGTGIKRRSQKRSKRVKQFSLDGTLVAVWPSMSEASRNGFTLHCIFKCCNNKNKTHRGYRWAYV